MKRVVGHVVVLYVVPDSLVIPVGERVQLPEAEPVVPAELRSAWLGSPSRPGERPTPSSQRRRGRARIELDLAGGTALVRPAPTRRRPSAPQARGVVLDVALELDPEALGERGRASRRSPGTGARCRDRRSLRRARSGGRCRPITELVFWNETANRSLGWKVSIAQAMASSAESSSILAVISAGSTTSPLIDGEPREMPVAVPVAVLAREGRIEHEWARACHRLIHTAHSPSPRSTL